MHSMWFMWFSHRRYRLCLVGCKIFSEKENIFKCLVAFQKIFWKIFSGVWLYSWKCSRKPIFIMFLTFSQLPNRYIIKSNKTQILNTQQKKKKIIESEINPKSENNKTRTTHATTTTTRKSKIKESKRIGDEIYLKEDRPRASRSAIQRDDLGFNEWVWQMVWQFLGSQWSVVNGFDDFWVCDDRWWMGLIIFGFAIWGMDSTARYFSLSRSLCVCVFESFLLSLSLSLWALLDEWARSWVFWVRRSSWMWIDLAFAGAGVLVRSLFLVVSLSLSSIFLGQKWFEVKMRTKIIFRPLNLILLSN